jgi:phosphatidylglycerophosphate synthase
VAGDVAPGRGAPRGQPAGVLAVDRTHSWYLLGALSLGLLTGSHAALVGSAWLAFARFLWLGRGAWLPLHFGPPNAVTLGRLVLVSALALGAQSYDGPTLAAIGLAVYALDGLDGWMARRWGFASDFGASFDVETDSFYVAVLGFALRARGVAGWWVLVPGFLRYAYVLSVEYFGWRGEAPRRPYARYAFSVAVVLFSLAFLPASAAPLAAAVATAIIVASFARSWWWAVREEPTPP